MKKYIKNFDDLATTKERKDLLTIIESAYEAIDTTSIINNNIKLDGQILAISGKIFNLKDYDHIYLIGFGKTSSMAARAVENILKEKISGGIIMDEKIGECKYVKQYICTHPRPSIDNILPSEELAQLAKSLGDKDLAIVIVSGGGSSMICWPESECKQGTILYDEFLKSGGDISELNTLRKHLSLLKGGGLAKLLYPATVASLIFCDVPGDKFYEVASGPTYKDTSFVKDAEAILLKYHLPFNLELNETTKEDIYFEKVHNIPIVTNTHALVGMEKTARELGYDVYNIGANLYQESEIIINKLLENAKQHSVVIGAGEPSVAIKSNRGISGRCEYLTMISLAMIGPDDTLSSFASDGIDNLSISAGAIADSKVIEEARILNLDIKNCIEENTIDEFFTLTKNQIITGETGSNVSDIMILLRK